MSHETDPARWREAWGTSTPPVMTEPPTMREELDRKAEECIERLVRHHEQGKIGGEAMAVGVRVVWETISGLASEDTSLLAQRCHREVGELPQRQHRIFRDVTEGTFAAAIAWTPGTCVVNILKPSGQTERFSYDTEAEAKARFSLLGDRLSTRYEEWR